MVVRARRRTRSKGMGTPPRRVPVDFRTSRKRPAHEPSSPRSRRFFLNVRKLRRDVREHVHPPPLGLQHESPPPPARRPLLVARVVAPPAPVRGASPVRLHRPRVALVEVRARFPARRRVDVVEHEPLELVVLDHAYGHGNVDDAPLDVLEAGGLGGRAGVRPEVHGLVYVPRLEGVPSELLGLAVHEAEESVLDFLVEDAGERRWRLRCFVLVLEFIIFFCLDVVRRQGFKIRRR
mmetsp:Transcript_5147/g.11149  ORF Transcript_5147/g.11149 Transcript_5147/m.11149 type:complete len:236 (-) Transcript_5147:2557-3264(-)